MKTEIIEIGDQVLCDLCNVDFTDPPNSLETGGMLVGSYGICPRCMPSHRASLERYNELDHIKDCCPATMPFKDWCLMLRRGDNTIKFTTFDKGENMFKK